MEDTGEESSRRVQVEPMHERAEKRRMEREEEKKKKRTSADQEEVRGEGVKGRKIEREGDSTYSLCNSLYHQPRSWRMNSDPSQPSAEAR